MLWLQWTLLIWLLLGTRCTSFTHPADIQALRALYNSTNGNQWAFTNAHLKWNFNTDPCQSVWQGVLCLYFKCGGEVPCRVFSLQLPRMQLKGRIPDAMGNMSALMYLGLSENELTGTIPSTLGGMNQLVILNMSYNSLTGSIPLTLNNMTNLEFISFAQNRLGGTMPSELAGLKGLQFLYLFENSLSGSVPSEFGSLSNLLYLHLSNNLLTATIPPQLGQATSLLYLSMKNNYFSGALPDILAPDLFHLSVAGNKLTGSLCSQIGTLNKLQFLRLDDNRFSSWLPSTICNMEDLEIILLQGNLFTGDLGDIFCSKQKRLRNVDVSDNGFNSDLPDSVFELPSLRIFSAVKNCFGGSLPESLCGASNLQILSLDGLTSGDLCTENVWDPFNFFSPSYFANNLAGELLDCLWTLPNLTTFSLSGNGLKGTLHGDVELSASLRNVSLSYNRLTSTIPDSIQGHQFGLLDLSRNRLRGAIMGMASMFNAHPNATVLSLTINRLTGVVPHSFEDVDHIDILNGNLFYCDASSPVPKKDPSANNYVCGSDSLSSSMYSFLILLAVMAAFFSLRTVWYFVEGYCSFRGASFLKWIHCMADAGSLLIFQERNKDNFAALQFGLLSVHGNFSYLHFPNIMKFISALVSFRQMCIKVTLVLLLLCMPTYIAFYVSNFQVFYTHDRRYGWLYSTAYLSGHLPAALLLLMYLFICGYVWMTLRAFKPEANVEEPYHTHMGKKLTAADVGVRRRSSSMMTQRASFMGPQTEPDRSSFALSQTPFRGSFLGSEIDEMKTNAMHTETDDNDASRSSFDISNHVVNFGDLSSITKRSAHEGLPANLSEPKQVNGSAGEVLDSGHRNTFFSKRSSVLSNLSSQIFGEQVPRHPVTIYLLYILIFVINCVLVIAVNLVYVFVLSSGLSTAWKQIVQIGMAGFKLFWNIVCTRILISFLPPSKKRIQLHVLLLVFNNLVAPSLATAVASENCFKELFFGTDGVFTSYSYSYCQEYYQETTPSGDIQMVCSHEAATAVSTEFHPPFTYSYQCGSTLLTEYVPVFIYTYTYIAFLVPIFFARVIHRKLKGTFFEWALVMIDGILRPQDHMYGKYTHLLHASSLMARYVQHLVLLLTFGACCPPLGAVILVALCSSTVTWQIVIARFIQYKLPPGTKLTFELPVPVSASRMASTTTTSVTTSAAQSRDEKAGPDSGEQRAGLDIGSDYGGPKEAPENWLLPCLRTPSREGGNDSNNDVDTKGFYRSLVDESEAEEIERAEFAEYLIGKLCELEDTISASWTTLFASIWLILLFCVLFYVVVLFDIAAGSDQTSVLNALWLPAFGVAVLLALRVMIYFGWFGRK